MIIFPPQGFGSMRKSKPIKIMTGGRVNVIPKYMLEQENSSLASFNFTATPSGARLILIELTACLHMLHITHNWQPEKAAGMWEEVCLASLLLFISS